MNSVLSLKRTQPKHAFHGLTDTCTGMKILKECELTFIFLLQNGGTLLHLYVDKPRVYTYILASHGVPINIQDTVSFIFIINSWPNYLQHC